MSRIRASAEDAALVALAEVRLRFRTSGFYILALLVAALTYLALPSRSAGYAFLTAGPKGAFIYDSGFVGLVSGFVTTVLFGFTGFFVAHNSMRRDRITAAGEVLASTPVSSVGYVAGKYLAAVATLGAWLAASVVTAGVVQAVRAEAAVRPGAFLAPVCLLALPTLTYTVGLGVATGALPARGSGAALNLGYLLYWLGTLWGSLSMSHFTRGVWIGFTAFEVPSFELARAFQASTVLGAAPPTDRLLQWVGLSTRLYLAPRLTYALLGPAAVALGLAFFRRFDPAR